MNPLLKKLEELNPARQRLVRMAPPLSPRLNPFAEDGVVITPAQLYGETFNSKAPVAYELIADGIRSGEITETTKILCASSGNTGLNAALTCKVLGIPCTVIMQNSTPDPKVSAIRVLGSPIDVSLVSSSTVERARELGSQPGYFDTDQYKRAGNARAQYKYLAPQLWSANPQGIDVLVASGGTLGTIGGLQMFAKERDLTTRFILALCEQGHEVPGARDEDRVKRDVISGLSVDDFDGKLYGTRADSFLASFALFPEMPWTPAGPTSGLAFLATLRFIERHKNDGRLGELRGKDGAIRVVFICPDDYRPYIDLYLSTLNDDRDFKTGYVPVSRLLTA